MVKSSKKETIPEVLAGESELKKSAGKKVKKVAAVEGEVKLEKKGKKEKKEKKEKEEDEKDEKKEKKEKTETVGKTSGAAGGGDQPKKKKRSQQDAATGDAEGAKEKRQKQGDSSEAASAWDDDADVSAAPKDEQKGKGGMRERISCTIFVGQLPYSSSADDIRRHFKACASDGEINVRLLTKKAADGGGSRGMAFVELASESAVHTALRMHHSVIAGRRINVERTVGGGGKNDDRARKLSGLRESQGKAMVQTVRDLCASILPLAEEEQDDDNDEVGFARVTQADIDERVLDFLCTVPTSLAEQALREAKALDMADVRNRSAYLMGVLKRHVTESDSVKHGAEGSKSRGGGSKPPSKSSGGGGGGGKGSGKGKGGGGSGRD